MIDQNTILNLSPSGKTGWPWTEASSCLSITMPDGSLWPKISIVTPSFNQVQFLEETIRSVLLQGYPNLEYIIIDGGSSDGSIDIIRKYEAWLAYWISEPDRGQSNAINKGFSRSSGEIMAWINSDDYYAPDAFKTVADTFIHTDTSWIAGNGYICRVNGEITQFICHPITRPDQWLLSDPLSQPSVFWKRSIWNASSGLDESLHHSLDYDLWIKFSNSQPFPYWLDQLISYFRIHEDSKSFKDLVAFEKENKRIFQHYRNRLSLWDQFRVWKYRQEKISYRYLTVTDRSESASNKIFYGLFYAPWIIFKRYFYGKVKYILLSRNKEYR